MSNGAMSNETDLDWLARNVHVWKLPFAIQSSTMLNVLLHEYHANVFNPATGAAFQITKAQWLARRAELQGEIESAKACADGELAGPVAAAFKPLTSIEDNQELNMSNKQDVKQDNGWFERGELPPVGVACETLAEPELQWVAAEVVAHRDGFAIVWVTSEKCGVQCDDPKHFRPIRTERELVIEEMVSVMSATKRANLDINAAALYDAGYRKDPK